MLTRASGSQAKYPLIKSCDMPNDVKEEVTDICLTAVENFPSDYEKSTHVRLFKPTAEIILSPVVLQTHPWTVRQNIKEALDRKLGGSWQVVAGERFSFQVTHQVLIPTTKFGVHIPECAAYRCTLSSCCCQCKAMQYLLLQGTLGILVWKA